MAVRRNWHSVKRCVPWLVAATLIAAPALAQQKFPVKPIRLVVAFTAGGTTDILARLIAPGMNATFGQPLVIEPRPGAGGTLAAAIVARATPDGYTLLATSPAIAISAVMNTNLPYDTLKDFAGVGEIGSSTTVLVVSPSLGVRTVKEMIAYANARPGKLLFGSTGAFTSTHFSAERFRSAAGFKAQHVAFKGQPEFLIEIMADRVQFGAPGLTVALPMIKDGKLTALVVANPTRVAALPDVPASPEVLPGWGRDGSQAWLAPAGTPIAIRRQISRELARNIALPEVRERLQNLGFHITTATPEEHEKNLRADIETFARIARDAGLKAK
jgi:tripartite-type tricarboxylate transporter receptor subunit TctC